MPAERLQKIIAAAGIASRRKAEEFIAAGRVTLNGAVVTEQGTKADPSVDKIAIDGKPLAAKEIARNISRSTNQKATSPPSRTPKAAPR